MATTEAPTGGDRLPRISRWIRAFVDNPFTKLTVGLILIVTSSLESYYSFHDDLNHIRVRVHHGVMILGFINVLAALPNLIEGLEHFLAFREKVPHLRRLRPARKSSRS